MIASYLVALREGLEAALIVGIALGVVRRLGRPAAVRTLWFGVAAAALLSLALALGLHGIGARLEGEAEQVFEGLTMLLAAAVLTWMIFWMQAQGKRLRENLAADFQRAVSRGQAAAMFSLAFLAVLREGVETALFLTAAAFGSPAIEVLVGGLLGLATAIALGWVLFVTTVRLDLARFFTVTGLLLLMFAAGLVGHAAHEFNELGWIPPVIEHLWDTGAILPDDSGIGQLLRALFGYNADPSLSEVLAYSAYLALVALAVMRGSAPGYGPWRTGRR